LATPSVSEGAPATPASHGGSGGEPVVHNVYSPSPLLIGIGLLFLYIGFEWRAIYIGGFPFPLWLLLGVIFFGTGIVSWIREDVHFYDINWVDHGVLPGRPLEYWAMFFFLGTEVMLFGGLFAVFFVGRSEHPGLWDAGHSQLEVIATGFNTLLLIASSVTYQVSETYIKRENRKMAVTWQIITIVLGLAFLARQILEYVALAKGGFLLSTDAYWSSFYILTGTHGLHVAFGITLITIGLIRTLMGHFGRERHLYLQLAGIYWHFVDIVWIFLFSVIYLQLGGL
jgi:heme/copper-type cytochrome/quinol oxidase subunit 3